MLSAANAYRQLEQLTKRLIRELDGDFSRQEAEAIKQVGKVLPVLRLDVRDYEYAQSRQEQIKWQKIAHNNIKVLEQNVSHFSLLLSPADAAELSALIEQLKEIVE